MYGRSQESIEIREEESGQQSPTTETLKLKFPHTYWAMPYLLQPELG